MQICKIVKNANMQNCKNYKYVKLQKLQICKNAKNVNIQNYKNGTMLNCKKCNK